MFLVLNCRWMITMTKQTGCHGSSVWFYLFKLSTGTINTFSHKTFICALQLYQCEAVIIIVSTVHLENALFKFFIYILTEKMTLANKNQQIFVAVCFWHSSWVEVWYLFVVISQWSWPFGQVQTWPFMYWKSSVVKMFAPVFFILLVHSLPTRTVWNSRRVKHATCRCVLMCDAHKDTSSWKHCETQLLVIKNSTSHQRLWHEYTTYGSYFALACENGHKSNWNYAYFSKNSTK